jgi:MtN3 and saliva related transmembrane protein
MDLVTTVGLIAGALTTASLLPQVLQIRRTKSARDISLKMFVAFCSGVFLWLVYGILLRETPIIVWNGITLALGLAIVVMKIEYS